MRECIGAQIMNKIVLAVHKYVSLASMVIHISRSSLCRMEKTKEALP